MDTEAFSLFGEVFEQFTNATKRKFEADKLIKTIARGGEDGSAARAFWKLVDDAFVRLKRQKDIRAFSFTHTAPSKKAEIRGMIAKSTSVPINNTGGKPLAKHWDAMWSAIAVQLYSGDLIPKTQADIERAMLDWLSAEGIDAGERTVRNRARALWQAMLEAE